MESNLFNLNEPDSYRCNVFRYSSSLSQMLVRVYKGMSSDPSFYLFFPDVGYFEGPINWQGADFRVGAADDCLDLMVRAGMVDDVLLDDPDTRAALSEAAYLYEVTTRHTPVRIIAGTATRLDRVPESFTRD